MWQCAFKSVFSGISYWIPFFLVLGAYGAGMAGAECPTALTQRANNCFTAFSTQLQNMHNSRHALCCGVDVETLRAFCSSYVYAMSCIATLRLECPKEEHHRIDRAMINLQGSEEELKGLCRDDRLYEHYARYQTCYMSEGSESEFCFQRYTNSSIRLMARLSHRDLAGFCGEMRQVMGCIKGNIERRCGLEAVQLVEILVKPMVRDSHKCDYSPRQDKTMGGQQPTQPEVQWRASADEVQEQQYITDQHDHYGPRGDGNGGAGIHSSTSSITALLLPLLLLMASLLARS